MFIKGDIEISTCCSGGTADEGGAPSPHDLMMKERLASTIRLHFLIKALPTLNSPLCPIISYTGDFPTDFHVNVYVTIF